MRVKQIVLKRFLEEVLIGKSDKEKIISDAIGVVLLLEEKGPLNKKELSQYQPLENLLTSIDLLTHKENRILYLKIDGSYDLTPAALENYS